MIKHLDNYVSVENEVRRQRFGARGIHILCNGALFGATYSRVYQSSNRKCVSIIYPTIQPRPTAKHTSKFDPPMVREVQVFQALHHQLRQTFQAILLEKFSVSLWSLWRVDILTCSACAFGGGIGNNPKVGHGSSEFWERPMKDCEVTILFLFLLDVAHFGRLRWW